MTKETLIKLRDAQKKADSLAETLKEKRDAFAKTIETESANYAELNNLISSLKIELTAEALSDYEANPASKTLDGGIKIRSSQSVEYDDSAALKWAKEKDMFLTLDKKAFEKAAAGMGLEFVKIVTVNKVTFQTAGIVVED